MPHLLTISDKLPPKDQAHFLPVFFGCLREPPFPVTSRDSLSQKQAQELRNFAIIGYPNLKALDSLRSQSLFPQAAIADIWTGMWTCITAQAEFIDAFDDHQFWARMIHDKAMRDRCATPMRYIMCYFMRTKEEENFQAVILGAGGTVCDVCSLLLKHLDTVLSDIYCGSGDPKWITQSLVFVLETIVMNDAQVMEVLAPQGIVKKLVNLSFGIHVAELQGASPAGTLFGQLQACIREGLRSGLLVSMAQCIDKLMSPTHPLYEPFVNILAEIVPGYLTSYSVLIRLERALELFKKSSLEDRFTASELEGIGCFTRITLRAEYDESHRSVKICDSLSCCEVKYKVDLRRCSQCMNMYYSSPECQKEDWVSRGHGQLCWSLPTKAVHKGGTDASTREKSFLRFLLQADYLTHKHTILALHGEAMARTPEQGPFYTAFNYAAGPVYLRVLPAKELSALLPAGAQRLGGAYQLRRHGAARGKMSLNVAMLPRGRREFRYWIPPMRSPTSTRLSDGLVRLVGKKTARTITGDEYDQALDSLVEEDDSESGKFVSRNTPYCGRDLFDSASVQSRRFQAKQADSKTILAGAPTCGDLSDAGCSLPAAQEMFIDLAKKGWAVYFVAQPPENSTLGMLNAAGAAAPASVSSRPSIPSSTAAKAPNPSRSSAPNSSSQPSSSTSSAATILSQSAVPSTSASNPSISALVSATSSPLAALAASSKLKVKASSRDLRSVRGDSTNEIFAPGPRDYTRHRQWFPHRLQFCLQEGLLRSQAAGTAGQGVKYLKSPLWWLGMSMMILGELCNFAAYAFVEAIVVTPLGALSVVVCAILSSIFLKERLTFLGWLGCGLCILGATVIALNAPQEATVGEILDFQNLFLSPFFLAYMGVLLVATFVIIFILAPRFGKTNMLWYILFKHWFIYVLIVVVMGTLVVEVYYLNVALALFNTAMVTPTYYVIYCAFWKRLQSRRVRARRIKLSQTPLLMDKSSPALMNAHRGSFGLTLVGVIQAWRHDIDSEFEPNFSSDSSEADIGEQAMRYQHAYDGRRDSESSWRLRSHSEGFR
ncbi:magnesium transporter NIPA-domain-containing protein [Mycena metata]|uniref:Magnesium transporter NIPA-domain-containing protein n=1 Tax=Mycena metata TaxID=1033252 RepID=A0AAD7MLU5_9AGAR|nr:magnesium transporter NIPA-domain-containing protein [Mycena metata]